ncbi:aldo/keto reductase [Streptomyces sp. NPDC058682]|uniref:aldo/keto reductase n=1 Tax=unclassified Streptomyces TaxID=2593676 RepID=UPI0022549323|nr:aldo/keto reductase [Streptomyces sp. NBC_01214]MCX4808620.1 aldo/keto reductase [Streptomyces sp. NBC_01214]
MEHRRLGTHGPLVPALGLGCMGMSDFYGPADPQEALATIRHALDRGLTHLDTADMYGPYTNEELVGRAIKGRRHEVFLATKFGVVRGPDPTSRRIDSTPAHARAACDASLARLGVDHIDLYYLHRRDPTVPVEDTIGAMRDLVTAGKIGHIGLSEVNADTLRRACATAPVAALQSEYSLFTRALEREILPTAHHLGVTLVAYSPLGRGLLTGTLTSTGSLHRDDVRHAQPRFRGANLAANLTLVQRLRELAVETGCTPAQLALAWLLARPERIVPLPGTRRRAHLDDNLAALSVRLAPGQFEAVGQCITEAFGARAPDLSRLEQ